LNRNGLFAVTKLSATLLAGGALAQARYLAPGQSGFQLGVGLHEIDGAGGWAVGAGFSLRGRFDLEAGYATRSYDSRTSYGHYSPGMSADGLRFGAAVTLFRPTSSFPVGIELAGRYAEATYSGERLEVYQYESSVSELDLGGVVYLRLPSVSSLEVLPAVGLYRGEQRYEMDSVEHGLRTGQTAGILVTAELGIMVASRVVLVPGFAHAEYEERWSLALRLLLPTSE
jgi:hypothetical protein